MKPLIFDTETSGLVKNMMLPLPKQPSIIEYFGHVLELHKEQEQKFLNEVEFICNPGFDIEPIITKITGLRVSDLVGKPKFVEYHNQILDQMRTADTFVAHNITFDINMLRIEMKRVSKETHDEFMDLMLGMRRICTVEATECIKGHRLSLSKLYEYLFEEAFPGAHRARADVNALTKCFVELYKRDMI